MSRAHDLIGWKFGKLKVVARHKNDPVGKTQWVCQCDCGGAHIARSDNLIHGRTTHCYGCKGHRRPPVKIECWYHLILASDPKTPGACVSGTAGFCTFSRGGKELLAPKWFAGRQAKRGAPLVLMESVRRAGLAGLIRCASDQPSVTGWIKRHAADITYHSHNEGDAVWGQWYARTGQWLGPEHEIEVPVDADALERFA